LAAVRLPARGPRERHGRRQAPAGAALQRRDRAATLPRPEPRHHHRQGGTRAPPAGRGAEVTGCPESPRLPAPPGIEYRSPPNDPAGERSIPRTGEAVARRAAELAAVWPLPAEDWEPIISQATRILDLVATLDELPLAAIEPAPVYQPRPSPTGSSHE